MKKFELIIEERIIFDHSITVETEDIINIFTTLKRIGKINKDINVKDLEYYLEHDGVKVLDTRLDNHGEHIFDCENVGIIEDLEL